MAIHCSCKVSGISSKNEGYKRSPCIYLFESKHKHIRWTQTYRNTPISTSNYNFLSTILTKYLNASQYWDFRYNILSGFRTTRIQMSSHHVDAWHPISNLIPNHLNMSCKIYEWEPRPSIEFACHYINILPCVVKTNTLGDYISFLCDVLI